MLNINKMTSGQESYYRELAREDYYLEGGEPPGQWVGTAAEKLSLFGQVKSELLSEIFRGELDGKKLVQRAPSQKPRTPGWDCTFSAPKSVSVAWSQADKELGNEIRAAHAETVNKALEYLEEKAGYIRERVWQKHRLALFSLFPDGEFYFLQILFKRCLLYTSPSPRDRQKSRMPSSA